MISANHGSIPATRTFNRSILAVITCLASVAFLGSCGGNSSLGNSSGTGVPDRVLQSIQIAPANATLGTGISQQFSAIGTYNDGTTADVTNTAGWAVSDASLASVTSSGVVTALAQGSPSITASVGAVHGSTALTIPDVSGGLILNTNPTDGLILKGTDPDGAVVSYYGNRDQNGVPQAFSSVSATQMDGSMQSVELDQSGRVITGYDTRGFNYNFEWSSDSQVVVTVSTNDGLGSISTSINLPSANASSAHGKMRQGEPLKQHPRPDYAQPRLSSIPPTFELPVSVYTTCGGSAIPETTASVYVDATTGGGTSWRTWPSNLGGGNFDVWFPTLSSATTAAIDAQAAAAAVAQTAVCTSPLLTNLDTICTAIDNVINSLPGSEAVPWVKYTTAVCKYGIEPSNEICEKAGKVSSYIDSFLDTPINLTVSVILGGQNIPAQQVSVLPTGPFPSLEFNLPCPAVSTVNVNPSTLNLSVGSTSLLTAEALNSSGQIIQSNAISFVWTSSDLAPSNVLLAPLNPLGVSHALVNGVSPGGPVNITATELSSAKAGNSAVTVIGGTGSIEIQSTQAPAGTDPSRCWVTPGQWSGIITNGQVTNFAGNDGPPSNTACYDSTLAAALGPIGLVYSTSSPPDSLVINIDTSVFPNGSLLSISGVSTWCQINTNPVTHGTPAYSISWLTPNGNVNGGLVAPPNAASVSITALPNTGGCADYDLWVGVNGVIIYQK